MLRLEAEVGRWIWKPGLAGQGGQGSCTGQGGVYAKVVLAAVHLPPHSA